MAELKTIVLASGGTGGHIFPAEALAGELKKLGYQPILITDKRFENYAGGLKGIEYHTIRSSTFSGGMFRRVMSFVNIGIGYLQARRLLKKIKPEVVVGFGGYPSFPTMLAAVHMGFNTIIHEQNSLLGRANNMLAAKVRRIATSFPEDYGIAESDMAKVVYTGNPVRQSIRNLGEMDYPEWREGGMLRILVTGGSQGASIFSTVVPEAIGELPPDLSHRIRVDQQCREADMEGARELYEKIGVSADLATFFKDMPVRIASSHILIARSGASTLAEITVAGRPAILVPYPHSTDDHQTANANTLEDCGGGWVIPQESFTPAVLSARIEAFLNLPSSLKEAAEKSKAIGRPDAARRLADMVAELAEGIVEEGSPV